MHAKRLILKETFTNVYNIKNFTIFIKEFFNNCVIINKEYTDYWNWSEFSFYINGYTHVGNYTDQNKSKITIFAVELKKNRSVERARSIQRNFISKLISKANYDAAIVAFYSKDEPKWRLSLVRLDYEFAKGRVKAKLTPAKRYSYLVGEREPCHTAMERLLPIFEDDKFNPTLNNIEEAFNVEKVTEEFFNKYSEKYFEFKKHLDKNTDFNEEAEKHNFTSEQFAKKLMGQLAFLYFLQKKGWLGVKVLPHMINDKQYKNAYFNYKKAAKSIVPKVYQKVSQDTFKLDYNALKELSDEDTDILAGFFNSEPWGSGTKSFMRDLFNNCIKLQEKEEKNFFDDYLEPLFYEALNHRRGENQYYKRFNCKIPFLNGGLFEPLENYDWQNSKFRIPDELFSNEHIKGKENADGILDIFDRYNFTMNEDEPFEREVAVDPEMLGKVFENLLDVKDRKLKGAFYTPREIVHYMCQESLINYLVNETGISYEDIKAFIKYGETMKDEDTGRLSKLETDEMQIPVNVYKNLKLIDDKLTDVRIADPAVGSGAFPMGMISEIVKARNNITAYYAAQYSVNSTMSESEKKMQYAQRAKIYDSRNPYKLKRDTIKNSIYAVDIEASAVDIAKLRLWLSLIIEEDLEPTYDDQILGITKQRNPQSLPNLDYNIMCGNSLIDEFEGVKLFDDSILNKKDHSSGVSETNWQLSLFTDNVEKLLQELFKQQDKLFGEDDTNRKNKIKKDIDKIIDDIIRAKLLKDGNVEGLEKYERSLKEKTKLYFLWRLEFAKVFREKDGFDIVIGNPPYVKEYTDSRIFQPLKSNPYYQGKMDLWYFFGCKGIDLLKINGIQTFIAPNNWITNSGSSKFRNKVLRETQIKSFIDFGNCKLFDSASIQTMVYILLKRPADRYYMSYSRLNKDKISLDDLKKFLYSMNGAPLFEKRIVDFRPLQYINRFIDFNSNYIQNVLNSIISVEHIYLNNDEIAQGIVTPQDNLNKTNATKLGNNYIIGEGIFVLSNDEVYNLRFNEHEYKLIKPYYTTEELGKYFANPKNNYSIIYTKSDINRFIDLYPNIKKHLDRFKKIITSDNKPYGLHRARNEYFFTGEKIISLRKCSEPTFTYVNFDCYVSQTFFIIKTERINQLYLTALLNCNLIKFWLLHKGKMQGDNYQIDKEPLLNIPIVKADIEIEARVIELVKQLLEDKKYNKPTEILEEKLNQIFYNVYKLSPLDISIIKSRLNKKQTT